ncbi:MAG: UDP-N-acetylmuramoyl-tripeptide--D-alanyl-D-alanine ligase [Methylacidiphilales bacterium]|nr:UDP-N-acetylmuramoyl-tripeptide--D-alanyl-D-alanine ligase [Candidatus Methylacidiphilales bacterium]MDW8349800.1 UDP-N-acetylmuramoyl-tripeptide--D-alanyl-D-alanine ligase [Verrucomicrobiae bacterium]
MQLALTTLLSWTQGRLIQGDADTPIQRIHTDTRSLQPGDLFLALQGDRFDGHDFIQQAIDKHAAALCLSRPPSQPVPPHLPILLVNDTLKALQSIAAHYRNSLPADVIAIVGSNGKTSTKDILAQILSRRFTITQTYANYNNHIGVPLTLLTITPAHHFAVVELGTNHPGEITTLAQIVQPDLVLITNIGREHLEFFKNQEAVAQEESSILQHLSPDGQAILNADDPWTPWIQHRYPTTPTTLVGLESTTATWRAEIHHSSLHSIHFTLHSPHGSISATLPSPAKFLLYNVLQASAAAHWAGLSLPEIQAAIAHLRLPHLRMQIISLQNQRTLLNDCYNANPDSMIAALTTLIELNDIPHKAAILGSMAELGDCAPIEHLEIGRFAGSHPLDWIIAVGPHAASIQEGALLSGFPPSRIFIYPSASEAIPRAIEKFQPHTALLIKGSRSVALETIAEALQQHYQN